MRKFFYSLFISLLFSLSALAQTEGISFQGLARNAAGEVLVSQKISLRLSILLDSESGTVAYTETRQVTTNPQGIFSLVVGDDKALTKSTNFSAINWTPAPKFIKVEMDPNGGTSYVAMGTSRLQAVPFAFHAYGVDATNVKGVLPVASGGTGVASISELKTTLGLDQVNNSALDSKVDKVAGKGLSTNDYTTAEKTKLAAITGTNTGDQDLSSFATTTQLADKANSSDVTTGLATKANASDVTTSLATKANASDVTTSLATKVDKVTGKELSTNDYTTAEKTKLAAITGTNTGDQVNITGNAGTATKLQNARTINGIAFDGSANITLPTAAAGIPYTGATQAVDLGAFDLKVNGITVGRGNGNMESNTAIGKEALLSNTTGFWNTATGFKALSRNTIGKQNTATGWEALGLNTIGDQNTAFGWYALYSNTTGKLNTAVGEGALKNNSTGEENSSFGQDALANNSTGKYNSTFGRNSFHNNSTGDKNTVLGWSAGNANTTGSNNTAIGAEANFGANNLTNATAIGYQASVAASNTIQLGNSSVSNVKTSGTITAGDITYPKTHGAANQVLSTTGSGTLTWATLSGIPYTGATQAVDLGAFDMKVNGITIGRGNGNIGTNTATGKDALLSNNSFGSDNTAMGNLALYSNTFGRQNTAIGSGSLNSNINGIQNTAVGILSLEKSVGVSYNTAVGSEALRNTVSGESNTATGASALKTNISGAYNSAFGRNALAVSTGFNNAAFGAETLSQNVANNNTAFGAYSLQINTTGYSNTAVGIGAMKFHTTGNDNVAVGVNAGLFASNQTTGSNNTAIGAYAEYGAGNLTNATVIGSGATVSASNSIRLGNASVTVIGGQVAWTAASDSRIKKNIVNSNYGLATVLKLRPVEYNLTSNDLKQVGFIAQEVQKLVPEVVTGKEGDLSKGEILGITYSNLVPVLTKAIQEQQKQIEDQNSKIAAQQKQIEELIKLVKGQ